MIKVSESISSLGMNTVDYGYTAVEILGNIQITSFFMMGLCLLWVGLFGKKAKVGFVLSLWAFLLCSALATLVISTFVRIWI